MKTRSSRFKQPERMTWEVKPQRPIWLLVILFLVILALTIWVIYNDAEATPTPIEPINCVVVPVGNSAVEVCGNNSIEPEPCLCPGPALVCADYKMQLEKEQDSNKWLMDQLTARTSFEQYDEMVDEFWHYQEYSEQTTYAYIGNPSSNMTAKAKELKGESVEDTITNVYNFVQEMDYEKFDYARGDERFLREKRGDCTDASSLAIRLLRIDGIQARQVHGWATDDEGDLVKHDWMEVLVPDRNEGILYWKAVDWFEFGDLHKEGDDVW